MIVFDVAASNLRDARAPTRLGSVAAPSRRARPRSTAALSNGARGARPGVSGAARGRAEARRLDAEEVDEVDEADLVVGRVAEVVDRLELARPERLAEEPASGGARVAVETNVDASPSRGRGDGGGARDDADARRRIACGNSVLSSEPSPLTSKRSKMARIRAREMTTDERQRRRSHASSAAE